MLTRKWVAAIAGLASAMVLLTGASCADLTGTGSSGTDWDGTYVVTSVDGSSVSSGRAYVLYVDASNYLVLTRGEWVVSGATVSTATWTTQVINGRSTLDPKFNPERHSGKISVSGNTATLELDTGSKLYATREGNGLTSTSNGRKMVFAKQ
jgi:hypothetical protein